MVNASINALLKASKIEPVGLNDDFEPLKVLLNQVKTIESQVEYNQLKQEIKKALAGLSTRERTAIVQRYYLGMSEKEMALSLSTPPGTVKWLLNTARESLRRLLGSERSAE